MSTASKIGVVNVHYNTWKISSIVSHYVYYWYNGDTSDIKGENTCLHLKWIWGCKKFVFCNQ